MEINKICDKEKCTRKACIKNAQYFPGLHLCTYHYELTLSFIGASCWIISEIHCNEYTKYGHVLWHILFPLGFYKLILKYDKIL